MFRYFKGSPDSYVVKFHDGKVTRHGRGISFYYMPSVSTVMALPSIACDTPFIFTEPTVNFQDVSLQGTVVYRITKPLAVAEQFDFGVDRRGKYTGEGADKLALRVINTVQRHARGHVSRRALEDVLRDVGQVTEAVAANVAHDEELARTGITVESLHFTTARAMPEVQKALQTEYREKIQREADEAIYARRGAAVENERKIKERELATEIELSNRRKQLVEDEAAATLIKAEAVSKAERMKMDVLRDLKPETIALLAIKAWSESGGSVANLTITPDIITGLVSQFAGRAPEVRHG